MEETSGRRQKEPIESMISRTYQSSFAGRAASMRRMRRRSHASGRLYCGTNGCASFLTIDPDGRIAVCEVCGFKRRLD
jgi:hypothetical protein